MCFNPAMNDQPTPATQTAIGFLGYREFDDGEAFRGAILVTDEWGKPLELPAVYAPVHPTKLSARFMANRCCLTL